MISDIACRSAMNECWCSRPKAELREQTQKLSLYSVPIAKNGNGSRFTNRFETPEASFISNDEILASGFYHLFSNDGSLVSN